LKGVGSISQKVIAIGRRYRREIHGAVRRIGILARTVYLRQPALRYLGERPQNRYLSVGMGSHAEGQQGGIFQHRIVGSYCNGGDSDIAGDVLQVHLNVCGSESFQEIGGKPFGHALNPGPGIPGGFGNRPGVPLDHLHQGVKDRLFERVA
jgi:hypothetical protein